MGATDDVAVITGPAEFCRLAANVVFVTAVLIMMAWWWLLNRPSSPTCRASSIGGEPAFETRAKALETAGDVDGAMQTLLAFWREKGSSTAMTLAHELSQRHPAEAFENGYSCPLQQESSRRVITDLAASASVSTTPAADADADADIPRTIALLSAVPAAALCTSKVLSDTDGAGGSATAPAVEKVPGEDGRDGGGGYPLAVQDTSPVVRSHDDDSSGSIDGKREAKVMAAVAVTEAPLGNNGDTSGGDRGTAVSTTSSTKTTPPPTTLPWERGWQGPEGFKPPSAAAVAASSSSVSSKITAGNAGDSAAVTFEPASPSRNSMSGPVEAAAGGGGGLAGKKAIMRRNFTVSQLNSFNGSAPAPKVRGGEIKAGKARPIYIALRGEVYDASAGTLLYGPVSDARQAVCMLGVLETGFFSVYFVSFKPPRDVVGVVTKLFAGF